MSIRSRRIPGDRLGLGTFINMDVDTRQRIVTYGSHTWTAGSTIHRFTQGQSKVATFDCIILSHTIGAALASASVDFKIATATGGTVHIRLFPNSAAANTNNHTITLYYWMVGKPDPQRIVL